MSKRIHWISRLDQVKTLTSPIRHDIVDRLTALGPLSVRALADALGRKPTAIYRHLVALQKTGLVLASEVTGARGRPAMIYRPAAPVLRLARAARIKSNQRPMAKIARALARQAAREYGAAFKSNNWTIDSPKRNHWVSEVLTAPSAKKLAKINALLDELSELIWTPDPNPGQPLRVTLFMSPVPQSKSAGKTR